MKFAFEEFHLWYQFALSLMAAGKVSFFANFVLLLAANGNKVGYNPAYTLCVI